MLTFAIQLASVVLATRSAVSQEETYPPSNFPHTAYIASHIGALLYFLAGLLPDPDGPWLPTVAHGIAWVVGLSLEVVIAGVFLSQQERIQVSASLLDSLASLGLVRLVLFFFMIAILARREYELKPTRTGSSEEHQSLLENGEGTNGYGSTPASGSRPPPKKPDAQSTGWLDYIAGFRVLFPYLW